MYRKDVHSKKKRASSSAISACSLSKFLCMNSLFFLCSLRSGIRGPVLSKQAFIFFSHTFLFTFNYLPNHEWCFSLRRSRWKYYFALVFLLFVLMVLMLSMPLLITTKYSRRLLGFFLLFLSLSLSYKVRKRKLFKRDPICLHAWGI